MTPFGRLRDTAGTTLAELLISVTLALTGMATFLSFQRAQFYAYQDQARQLDVQTAARNVVDLFAREARRAGMDPNCTNVFPGVVEASASQVRMQADFNANGVLDAASEDLTYRLSENLRIERVGGETAEVLLGDFDLQGSRFRYFDGAGAELVPGPALSAAQRASVRRVRIELVASSSPADPTHSVPLVARTATDVELRNRFFIEAMGCP